MLLFHLGIVDEPPRSSGPVPFADWLADLQPPIRETVIAYLERKRATCQPKTVSAIATRLKHGQHRLRPGAGYLKVGSGLSHINDLVVPVG
ncbi:hypothetical protein [Saccharopolyspora sp. ASAGF58]|uniref:hypothetical protein n=1 Tax=Saccharopolyspora sp. ASAGF58 TaxID=2719023 RepID=UPI00143FE851|nr:hypothetical protein [Saccharopolyspora sp. ASAGF58]QIZ38746.1 hypothetical protein FDZ84_34905 [Saccharopolyspora sp. ASAGF58]